MALTNATNTGDQMKKEFAKFVTGIGFSSMQLPARHLLKVMELVLDDCERNLVLHAKEELKHSNYTIECSPWSLRDDGGLTCTYTLYVDE